MTQSDLQKQNQESFSRLKTKFDSETVVFYVNTLEFSTWNELLDWNFWTIEIKEEIYKVHDDYMAFCFFYSKVKKQLGIGNQKRKTCWWE